MCPSEAFSLAISHYSCRILCLSLTSLSLVHSSWLSVLFGIYIVERLVRKRLFGTRGYQRHRESGFGAGRMERGLV